MGASCSSATPVSDEDQEQDQEQQQLPQRRQSEREVAPKDKDKEDEDENPEHHQHQHQQQQQQPTEVSAGRRQQSNISTSSRYLNSLIRGGGGGGNTAAEHTDSVILQPVRLPSHQSHRLHHQNPNQQQQQLNSGSSGQGPIRYRLEDVRPFASSHFAQLLQEQQQQQEQEEEGTLENDENRYDRSLVQRYLEKSTSLSSSGSGQMGKEGNGPRGKAAITVSKSKLQLGGSSAGRSNLLQSPVKGKGERGRRAAAAAANSSTTSTSTSTTSATSILSNRRSLRGKESVTGKRKPHSRLSVDSEKTIYQCKKKSAAAHSAAAAAAAKTRAQKQQQHQPHPRPPQLPTPLQQQQHQQQCLSLMAHSRDRVIEQVKSGAQVPTPLVLKVRGYVFQRVVASGAHSTLYQVLTYRMHTQELACKHIHKGAFPPQSQAIMRAFLKEETAILGQVKHDNIVSMLEIITTPTDVYIIMNFAANGTIFDYLYKEWKKPLPETMARRWMRDLMLGLEYLHDRMAIVHRDLKLENFLLTERYDALLSDFGLAVQLKQPQAARLLAVHCGTADYMAPELNVTNHGGAAYHVNPLPADIYAMGVSLFELLNYYRPYALSFSASSHSVLYRQQHRLYQLNRRVVLDLAAQRLLAALLEPVPVKRPKAAEVLAHDWFRGPTAS